MNVNHIRWKTDEFCLDSVQHEMHPCDVNSQTRMKAQEHCSVLKGDLFKSCHFQVSPEKAYQDCLFDMCSCDLTHPNCLCPILSNYGDMCVEKGVEVDWRISVRECGMYL